VGARRYVVKKTIYAFITLLFVISFNFFLFRVSGGNPVLRMVRTQHLTPEDVVDLNREFGFDRPLVVQYVTYVKDTLTFDWGRSIYSSQPVWKEITASLWPTIVLLGLGTIFATLLGIWIGVKGGWRRGGKFDTGSLFTSQVFWSMSEAWLGMVLIWFFVGLNHFFPAGQFHSPNPPGGTIGYWIDTANHLFLPVLTLTLAYYGEYTIVMRSSLIEVMNDDFVTTARAKGVPDRLVRKRHAVPNAFLPTFTLIFLSFGFVLSGAILIEIVFSWPGIGRLTFLALGDSDYPVLQGVFLISSATVILFNLLADITYGYLDPRIRQS
jgi:peptide/nickel transport system permease protein